jgi:hypothetical protein
MYANIFHYQGYDSEVGNVMGIENPGVSRRIQYGLGYGLDVLYPTRQRRGQQQRQRTTTTTGTTTMMTTGTGTMTTTTKGHQHHNSRQDQLTTTTTADDDNEGPREGEGGLEKVTTNGGSRPSQVHFFLLFLLLY